MNYHNGTSPEGNFGQRGQRTIGHVRKDNKVELVVTPYLNIR